MSSCDRNGHGGHRAQLSPARDGAAYSGYCAELRSISNRRSVHEKAEISAHSSCIRSDEHWACVNAAVGKSCVCCNKGACTKRRSGNVLLPFFFLVTACCILKSSAGNFTCDFGSCDYQYEKRIKELGDVAASTLEKHRLIAAPTISQYIKESATRMPIGSLVASTTKKFLAASADGLTNSFLVILFVVYLMEKPAPKRPKSEFCFLKKWKFF